MCTEYRCCPGEVREDRRLCNEGARVEACRGHGHRRGAQVVLGVVAHGDAAEEQRHDARQPVGVRADVGRVPAPVMYIHTLDVCVEFV